VEGGRKENHASRNVAGAEENNERETLPLQRARGKGLGSKETKKNVSIRVSGEGVDHVGKGKNATTVRNLESGQGTIIRAQ